MSPNKGHQKTHLRSQSSGPYEESWEPKIAKRIQEMVIKREQANPELDYPLCTVALVGVPGSGKTVSSFILANLLEQQGIGCMVMPHDGYHYPIELLETFPDAEDAVYRRGAPDTFDPVALRRDLMRIRGGDDDATSSANTNGRNPDEEEGRVIKLPGFDHAKGDSEPDVHTFDRLHHKVVLCEGLYLLHDSDGWENISSLFDLKIFLDSDVDICIDRLKIRNQCIPGYTPEEIAIRCEKVDRANAMTVMKSKHRADIVVKAIARPIQKDEIPDKPTLLEAALTRLELTEEEKAGHRRDNSDWTMDIVSGSSAGLAGLRSRSNSITSQASEPPPQPAAMFAGTWEPEQGLKIVEAVDKLKLSNPSKLPYMVALVGTPGSGKSVSSFLLANILEEKGYPTMICPHDGYHYPLEHLKTFPDAQDFLYRRGAPDTFDPKALYRDLDRIKNGDEAVIKLPAFDHAKADPEPDTHIFDRKYHKVVLCEGLYLLHDQDGWEDISSLFDFTIFMNSDVDVCIERVKIRNQCIPGYTPEEIEVRCEKVDRVNAMTVMRSKDRAHVVVDSSAIKKPD